MNFLFTAISHETSRDMAVDNLFSASVVVGRVPTCQGKVREICFFFKVREKSGNSVKWSGKLENFQKSGKSQGILKS